MKRIGNLYEKVISLENLRLADEKARKGKLHSYGVRLHDKNRENNLIALHESLKNGTFKTSKYHVFTIHEPKERQIYRLPYYPDRILHHAIMNILEPIWVSIFTKNTYSCIKNRGIHKCQKDLLHALKNDPEGTTYCLKIDIKKFYPSIQHSVLKGVIRRKIKDKRLLNLLDEIIDSVNGAPAPIGTPVKQYTTDFNGQIFASSPNDPFVNGVKRVGDDLLIQGVSVPIGNYLSQYFANLVLAYFDHWIKEVKKVKYYFRYADDIVILSGNKQFLHDLLHDIRAYLRKLELRVKKNYQVFPVESRGIDYLGFVSRHKSVRLRKRIKKRLCVRVAKLNKRKKKPLPKQYKRLISPWWGWLKYSDSKRLFNKLQQTFPYEIRFD